MVGLRSNIGPAEPSPDEVFALLRAVEPRTRAVGAKAFDWILGTNDVLMMGAVRVTVGQWGPFQGLIFRDLGHAVVIGTQSAKTFSEFVLALERSYKSGVPGAIETARAITKGGVTIR